MVSKPLSPDTELKRKVWNGWEKRLVFESNAQGITICQFPTKVVGLFNNQSFKRPAQVKSEIDFAMGLDGKAVFFDAKVTHEPIWNLKKYVFNPKKIHQYTSLLTARTRGNISGYMILFQIHDLVVWVPIEIVERCYEKGIASVHYKTPGVRCVSSLETIPIRDLILGNGKVNTVEEPVCGESREEKAIKVEQEEQEEDQCSG